MASRPYSTAPFRLPDTSNIENRTFPGDLQCITGFSLCPARGKFLSRSKHTRSPKILAASRVLAPYERRGSGDPSLLRRLSRQLKELGVVLDPVTKQRSVAFALPRVVVTRPRRGFIHPVDSADLVELLKFFGPPCFYGLRSIRLIQGSTTSKELSLPFGRLVVPGTIILYEQPKPPWFVCGSIPRSERVKLERSGASIESSDDHTQCLIHWKKDDLKAFMLFEVFMHEVGHHIIQQYKGKRNARVMRTKDHERWADAFVRRCRQDYSSCSMSDSDA